MREVKIFSPKGSNKTIKSAATDWDELKEDLIGKGVSYDNMKAVVGETKNTLEAGGAKLPEGNFTLFLMNKKTKSGADVSSMKYRELRSEIQSIISDNDDAKDHFNEGRNYTTKSTAQLRELLESYYDNNAEDMQEDVPAKEETTTTSGCPAEDPEATDLQKLKHCVEILRTLDFTDIDAEIDEDVENAVDNLAESMQDLEAQSNPENEKLSEEYNSLRGEFDDVQ